MVFEKYAIWLQEGPMCCGKKWVFCGYVGSNVPGQLPEQKVLLVAVSCSVLVRFPEGSITSFSTTQNMLSWLCIVLVYVCECVYMCVCVSVHTRVHTRVILGNKESKGVQKGVTDSDGLTALSYSALRGKVTGARQVIGLESNNHFIMQPFESFG